MRRGLKDYLAEMLEPWELSLLYRSYDVVGDIAVIRVPPALKHRMKDVAEAVVQTNKHIKTVLCQSSPVQGDLRLRELEWVAGERKTETIHKEWGCVFKVDLARCYFSPRLSYERMRIASQVKPYETVTNMFAGVGCFSIVIAKHAKPAKVYSIDINPVAVHYARENVCLNKVGHIVEVIEGDSKTVIVKQQQNTVDRVLMPLPEKAYEYLEYALAALKPDGGAIHYYDFVHAGKDENPVDKIRRKVAGRLKELGADFDLTFGRIVRTVGPRWFQIVVDIRVYTKR